MRSSRKSDDMHLGHEPIGRHSPDAPRQLRVSDGDPRGSERLASATAAFDACSEIAHRAAPSLRLGDYRARYGRRIRPTAVPPRHACRRRPAKSAARQSRRPPRPGLLRRPSRKNRRSQNDPPAWATSHAGEPLPRRPPRAKPHPECRANPRQLPDRGMTNRPRRKPARPCIASCTLTLKPGWNTAFDPRAPCAYATPPPHPRLHRPNR